MKTLKLIHSLGFWSPAREKDSAIFSHLTNGCSSVNKLGLEQLQFVASLHNVILDVRQASSSELEGEE